MSTNGHDPNTAKMVDLLSQLVADGRETRTGLEKVAASVRLLHEEVKRTNQRVDLLHEDLLALRADVVGVKNEVSGLRTEIRADLADHEERIRKIERGAA